MYTKKTSDSPSFAETEPREGDEEMGMGDGEQENTVFEGKAKTSFLGRDGRGWS